VLIGSTKIITIVVSYFDIFFGFPLRFVFGFINDRLKGVAPRARARTRAAPAQPPRPGRHAASCQPRVARLASSSGAGAPVRLSGARWSALRDPSMLAS
jgi:hypothetical protein